MNCQRCDSMWGESAVALVCGELLRLKVCGQCAKEASDFGFHIEALERSITELELQLQAA